MKGGSADPPVTPCRQWAGFLTSKKYSTGRCFAINILGSREPVLYELSRVVLSLAWERTVSARGPDDSQIRENGQIWFGEIPNCRVC